MWLVTTACNKAPPTPPHLGRGRAGDLCMACGPGDDFDEGGACDSLPLVAQGAICPSRAATHRRQGPRRLRSATGPTSPSSGVPLASTSWMRRCSTVLFHHPRIRNGHRHHTCSFLDHFHSGDRLRNLAVPQGEDRSQGTPSLGRSRGQQRAACRGRRARLTQPRSWRSPGWHPPMRQDPSNRSKRPRGVPCRSRKEL